MTEARQPLQDESVTVFLTPNFVVKQADGVIVLIEHLQLADDFVAFVDRMHACGERFAGMNFELVQKLLYDADALAFFKSSSKELRIASDIVPFPELRKKLYRAVKVLENGKRVEYLFEPVTMEVTHQEPVYGEPDDTGLTPIIDYVDKTEDVPATLNFDEFFAAIWLKGVKFGLDELAIREAIGGATSMRRTIARQLDPTAGRDAEIKEASPDLHRDNSPKILANGKADLSQFKNRFPQMAKGARLLKKLPRVLGRQGRTVGGDLIEPALPKDLDLYALTSVGTKVEVCEDGEYIVATLDGFLTLDPKSNQVSVTEKIENKGGISVKTTGDLVLNVDEFVEHGEVQEGRVVKGRNMTFLSDVFGRVISEGGNIHLKKNLSGGVADTLSGDIELASHVSRSLVRSGDGEVMANFCESSTLIGKCVRVEHAVSCEIVADEIEAGILEGCMVVAKKIHIHTSDEHRGNENLVTLLIPDLSRFDQLISKLQNDIAEARSQIGDKTQQLDLLKSDSEFAKFLVLAERIKSGTIKITPDQAVNWRKLVEKHAQPFAQSAKLLPALEVLETTVKQAEDELKVAVHERIVATEGVSCVIDHIVGQTSVRTMCSVSGVAGLAAMQPAQIRETLLRMDAGKMRIFSENSGTINWQFDAS